MYSKIANETLIVTYSPKYKAYQREIREGQIERAKAMVETKGKLNKTHCNPNDPARFLTSTSTTAHGEVAGIEYKTLNQEAIDKESMYELFGFRTDIQIINKSKKVESNTIYRHISKNLKISFKQGIIRGFFVSKLSMMG